MMVQLVDVKVLCSDLPRRSNTVLKQAARAAVIVRTGRPTRTPGSPFADRPCDRTITESQL